MFSSLATPPSMNPIAQRSGIRFTSVREQRRIVILSSSASSRSSTSRKDNVHPQQPHRLIMDILILSARLAANSGSRGVAGSSCDAIDFVTDVLIRTAVRERAHVPIRRRRTAGRWDRRSRPAFR